MPIRPDVPAPPGAAMLSPQWPPDADLFGPAPVIFASLSGPGHIVETANSAFFDIVCGGRRRTGVPIVELIPDTALQGVINRIREVYRTGVPYRTRDKRLVLGEPGAQQERIFDLTYEPRRDAVGRVDGVVVIAMDTTAYRDTQLLAAEQRALLEQIAREAPLQEILTGMARTIEDFSPGMLVSVLLVDADGRRLRHGTGPSLPDFYNEAIDGVPIGEGQGSCGTTAYRRAPVVCTDIATDPLWAEYRELAKRAGVGACWSTPILSTDGRLLGTFAMYHRTPKIPELKDLALGAAFTRVAALAIERHQAVAAGRAARQRESSAREDLAFVLEASTAIAREQHYANSLRRLAQLTVPSLAQLCAVYVADGGHHSRIASAAATRAHEPLLVAPEWCEAVDRAVARVLASGATETGFIELRPGTELGGRGAGYLCVPLTARGSTFGALALLAVDRDWDGHVVALAEELAGRAALSADNARQFTHRVRLAHELQAGLLPPKLPHVPGAALAASYHPAGEGLDVGGDFYDVFPLPGDRWAVMIGDVCGHGAVAATTTGMVRHTARAVARLLRDPVSVVAAINDALAEHTEGQDLFVSLVYGELRHTTGGQAVTLMRAGHVPPLVRRAGGTVERLVPPGLLLGLGLGGVGSPVRVDLHPGDGLVLVTDGITEARSPEGELFGEERLADTLTTVPPTAAALLESVTTAVAAFTHDTSRDDQAALVVTAV
ncbi:SpoIIE family protein phosphatase [Streptomyces sp. NPDC003758]|uniref:SpoIIE family protein phosphatase n=1 Tax=Streptomyces cynarae TaxID=2981134 RepID=A0ABY6ECE2_9ACTN|nr:SpoIIE family protein phosphatase [Streptomyces cynarae]UXY23573.1 SpoIIE family protein phosphatase [Streptomyces cynarae]